MSQAVLHYFQGRGRAEVVRMLLTAGNIPFKQVYYEKREEFLQAIDDGRLTFKALPLLQIDGINIVQTNAILQYIAAKCDLAGQTPEEKARVNMYFEGSRDLYSPFIAIGFTGTAREVADKVGKSAIPKFLPIYNDALAKSTSGYLVGSKSSLADVGFLEVLFAMEDFYEEDKLADYPHVKNYLAKMKKEDWVVRYLRDVRMPPNDDKYITIVRTVLNF